MSARLPVGLFACCLVMMCGCAAHTHSRKTAPSPALVARELMGQGQLDSARAVLRTVRDDRIGTPEGAEAQYLLAYLEVFYNNPSPDWQHAIDEFKRLVADYPGGEREVEANSWIRLLSAYAYRAPARADTTAPGGSGVRQLVGTGADSKLIETVQRCYTEKDSLKNRIRLLEEVIETIEKNH